MKLKTLYSEYFLSVQLQVKVCYCRLYPFNMLHEYKLSWFRSGERGGYSLLLISAIKATKTTQLSVVCLWHKVHLVYKGGPKSNWTLNLAREVEVVVRCTARCCGSTQYSSSLLRGVNLG